MILFLHGAGETGSDNLLQINGNIDNLLSSAKERGAFLYAPQATTVAGSIFNWNDVDRTNGVMAKIDEVLANQNADQNRVYITGLSMGGRRRHVEYGQPLPRPFCRYGANCRC